jgi:hypothetical protein
MPHDIQTIAMLLKLKDNEVICSLANSDTLPWYVMPDSVRVSKRGQVFIRVSASPHPPKNRHYRGVDVELNPETLDIIKFV